MKTDVLIIGGSAAGMVTALSGKTNYPEKEFTVVRTEEKVMVPCGIPYIFGSLDSSDQNVMPTDANYDKKSIKHLVKEVTEIDKNAKVCKFADGEAISYEKLVIATGSEPIRPKWLKGATLENVFTIPKKKDILDDMKNKLRDLKDIVVIGAGFIGVEISDELIKTGKNVSLVELKDQILPAAFDKEIADKAEQLMSDKGIKIITGNGITEIVGDDGKVKEVVLQNGTKIKADAVILSMGYRPNIRLAEQAGLTITSRGFISVDEYMRTSDCDIMAVGDCAEKRNFVTRKQTDVMLASTACAEGRIAGMNLYKLSAIKTFSGTIAIYSTAIGDTALGTAGITEQIAKEEGFDVVTGIFEGIDKHPGTLPGTHKQAVKLIVARESGVIIGGEAIGGPSAGELTNLLGFIIQSRTSLHTLLISQIGTQPMLTGSPAAYPLLKAAETAAQKIKFAY